MPFGKYIDEPLDKIPASYLLWIAEEDYCPQVLKAYVDENLNDLVEQAEESRDDFNW